MGRRAERAIKRFRDSHGSGLVAGNPSAAPAQAYSWLVLPDGTVASFIDRCAAYGDLVFIGAFAPFARLQFAGDRVTLADAS